MEVGANLRGRGGEAALGTADTDPVTAHLQALIRCGQAGGEFAEVDAEVPATLIRAAIDTAAARGATDSGFDQRLYTRELVFVVRRTLEVRS